MLNTEKKILVSTACLVFGSLFRAKLDLEHTFDCRDSDDISLFNKNQNFFTSFSLDAVNLRKEFKENGLFIIDDVLDGEVLNRISGELHKLIEKGLLEVAPDNNKFRQDAILWLRREDSDRKGLYSFFCQSGYKVSNKIYGDDETGTKELFDALRKLQSVTKILQDLKIVESGDLVIPMKAQLAAYHKGGGYVLHRDACNSSVYELGLYEYWLLRRYRKRIITIILYLNLDTNDIVKNSSKVGPKDQPKCKWNTSLDGGALRCFLGADDTDCEGTTATCVRDIAPVGGTLVVFDAKKVLHQVMPMISDKRRVALTIWIESKV